MADNTFVEGIRVYKPSENAPDFIKANLKIECNDLLQFMKENHKDGVVRAVIKESSGGNYYMALDSYKAPANDAPPPPPPPPAQEFDDDDIPF